MAIFHDSGEHTPIFEKHNKMLSDIELEQYIEKYGEERALGYMQAMRDLNSELKYILGGGYAYDGPRATDARIRGGIINLFHANDEVIHNFVSKKKNSFDI